MNEDVTNILLDAMRRRSERKVGLLAKELVYAASEDKEVILAGLEIERWLAETCRECLDRPM